MRLKFRDNKFRIMQIADVQDKTKVSPDTINLINAALDKEKPDLVVYSGDQIWGYPSFRGSKEKVEQALRAITAPVVERGIPFTICFGNHDRQVGVSNKEQFEIYKKIDGFVGEDTEGIDGCANHCIEIADNESIKYLLYLIDSNTSLSVGYDNVHKNQIEWYKATRDKYEKENGSVIPSVVIQHIPVPEIDELLTVVKKGTKGAVQGDVKGIYFGHDHINSFNGKVRGIDLGYTQGAGFHVYGPGLDRGVRMINLHTDGSLDTYDLRYRNLVGKKVKEKIRFGIFQIMPTNVYDAIHRGIKTQLVNI